MSYAASNETISRLRWHAGLDQPPPEHGPAIAGCTGTGTGTKSDHLAQAVADVISTLGELNRELNGPVPSTSVDGANQIPRVLAYAITEITRMLCEDAGSAEAAWTVETAWSAVLAGDIDDLEQHLRYERAARRH